MPPKKRGVKRTREQKEENLASNNESIDVKEDVKEQPPSSFVEEDEDAPLVTVFKMSRDVRKGTECPYLDTISRQNLDFDFEKCCSISLTHVNVYVCLVCGKYFQGRGPSTHAYTHSLEAGHHMYMKLDSGRCYCLPDMYEVIDRSLSDIQYVLNPTYTKEDVKNIATSTSWSRSLDGTEYMPGLVGLNNMKQNDYANVIFQALNRISPLCNFFLISENYKHINSPLIAHFGELIRKIWNSRAFKGHVSPHEVMHAVMNMSKRRFLIEKQSDPVDFYSWITNTLHNLLTQGKRKHPSIITESLQGELEVKTLAGSGKAKESLVDIVDRVPFLLLTLDLPQAPLFKDALDKVIIPQIPIFDLFSKFNGEMVHEDIHTGRRTMKLTRLPKYLVVHVKRFVKNQFYVEKNPTIVNFPIKGLDLSSCIPVPRSNNKKTGGTSEDQDQAVNAKYDLVANIVHEGKAGEGLYKVHICRQSEDVWYEVQDLRLVEVLPQVVVLSEAYLQVYCLRGSD